VKSSRIEITCGEAPYLVSRYDTTTGEPIAVEQRIGILDRKLRVVNENTEKEKEWLTWTKRAYQNTYGYEYQGDNLLLARENLLYTFVDNFRFKFHKIPNVKHLKNIAEIISQNIWQMDGLTYCSPYSTADERQLELFSDIPQLLQTTFCQVKDWQNNAVYLFRDLKGDKAMKFDFAIGNPPYQIPSVGDKPSDESIYHYFMDAAFVVANKVELITPARFLFNGGNTPKKWNEERLADKHFKVLRYEPDSKIYFSNTDIKGGIAITYRDANADFGSIKIFTSFTELNSILQKVQLIDHTTITDVIFNQNRFNLDSLYIDYPILKNKVSSEGKERRMTSGCLSYDCFSDHKHSEQDVCILGVINNKRIYKYISPKYVDTSHENLNKYKVIVPANNGSGALGEVLSTPLIGEPLIGYTQTFISVGEFDSRDIAENALKYIKSKFARVMLGILKITQNGKKETWKLVPLQDFTDKSDIDWSKSIHEIDLQLYQKYGLNDEEIKFIETMIRPME
jgi:type II restriction enzyme